MTGKDLDEVSLNTDPTAGLLKDVTNRGSLCLHLSEDKPIDTRSCQDIEELVLENKALAANILGLSQPKAFLLQLSLSQTQTSTDVKLNNGVISRPALEGTPTPGVDSLGNLKHECQGGPSIVEKENCIHGRQTNSDEPVVPRSLGLASASLDTDVTELYLLPARHSSQLRGINGTSANLKASRHGKRAAEDMPSRVRGGKRVKCKSATVVSDDVEAAIGLAVATAETLVIADIMNASDMFQSQGSKTILDVALLLKRGREVSGLDRFTLEGVAYEGSPDPMWDEDLVDDVSEAEFLVTLPDEQKATVAAPCGHAPPAAIAQMECSLKTELALTASKLVDNEIETSEPEQPQIECERTYSDVIGEVQKVIDGHGQAQSGDLFNSRWLGGWTGVKLLESEQVDKGIPDYAHDAAKRRLGCHLNFETSELSESCQSLPPRGLGRSTDGIKVSLSENHDGTHEVEALTAGSCAEVLLALSQASVKSLQEPLCSFVPCSVNMRPKPSLAEEAGCNGRDHNTDGGDGREEGGAPNTDVMGEHMGSLQIDSVTGRSCDDDQNKRGGQCETSSLRGVKWVHANSLRAYSMNPLSPLLEAAMQKTDKPNIVHLADKEGAPLLMRCEQRDVIAEIGEPLAKSIEIGGHMELILQDSGVQDSPPIIWHCGKKRRLQACRIVEESNVTVGDEACDSMPHDELMGKFEKAGKAKVAYNRRKMMSSSISSQLFKGVVFLITGFPATQKSSFEDVCRKIQDHSGIVLSSIPNFSSRDLNLKQPPPPMRHAVVVAPRKVRTLKYLYGCAAGLLIVKPNWIDQCLSTNTLLSLQKLKGKGLNGQHHTGLRSVEGEANKCMFSRIAAFVHGQHSYYSKLALLIQHGGGKVFRSMKSLLQPDIKKGSLIGIVVAEHPSKLPQAVKEMAPSAGLPIVAGDWIIDSLLDGKLRALPGAANACSVKREFVSNARRISQEPVLVMRNKQLEQTASLAMAAREKAVILEKDVNEPIISFLGKGAASCTLSRMGISFVLEMTLPKGKKRGTGHIYYKEACINGTVYCAGDIVEIRPELEEEKEPYIAQIESFYASSHYRTVNTRSAKQDLKQQLRKACRLCCRWFYRPSDTGFLCVGREKEVYLSQHFDDRAPVDTIIRKIKMVLVLEGKVLANDAGKGWQAPMGTSCTAETADYVCRFFYDFRKESLHQLKAALKSSEVSRA